MIRTPLALAMLLLAGSANADEAEIDGLILNGTITRAGQAFYRFGRVACILETRLEL